MDAALEHAREAAGTTTPTLLGTMASAVPERSFTIDSEIVHFEAGQFQAALRGGFRSASVFIPISVRMPLQFYTVTVDGRNGSRHTGNARTGSA